MCWISYSSTLTASHNKFRGDVDKCFNDRFDAIDGQLVGVSGRLDAVDDHLESVNCHLNGADGDLKNVNRHLRVYAIDSRLVGVSGRLDAVDNHLGGVNGCVRDIDDYLTANNGMQLSAWANISIFTLQ